jgi:hypothetical protein
MPQGGRGIEHLGAPDPARPHPAAAGCGAGARIAPVTALAEQRWEARLFAIGSACFALGAVPGFAGLVGVTADAVTFFVGSLFFTIAAFVQWRLTGRWQRGAWRSPAATDWWSAAVQFAGTLFFNVSTLVAIVGSLSTAQEDHHVWRPDALGSICFLVSSGLAVHATTVRDRLWDPAARTWQTTWVNLAGSVAFGASAIAAYVVPSSGEVANAAVVNLGTFLGALCFLAGALLMAPARQAGA